MNPVIKKNELVRQNVLKSMAWIESVLEEYNIKNPESLLETIKTVNRKKYRHVSCMDADTSRGFAWCNECKLVTKCFFEDLNKPCFFIDEIKPKKELMGKYKVRVLKEA